MLAPEARLILRPSCDPKHIFLPQQSQQSVELGDWVVGDADGVVVVPDATIADVINAGRVRASKEARMFRALWEGQTTLDLLGLDASPIQEGDEP